jgi:two-component system, NarL family, response regulator DegU
MNIVIVEDNPLMRQILRETVSAFANVIGECSDGVDALAAYQRGLPDWLLMDWEMPIRDGIAATTEVLAAFPNAQICMVSAYPDAALRQRALAAGARAFVCKDQLDALEGVLSCA